MESVSVYGHDLSMMEAVYRLSDIVNNTQHHVAESASRSTEINDSLSDRCYLLELPLEVRSMILCCALPQTVERGKKGIVWRRGCTSILAVNTQLFNEGIQIMYGENTFVVDVNYDCATFAYQWLLDTGLMPKRTMAFPDQVAYRNRAYLRRLLVRVHHVDSYTGMVKYGYSGHGLTEGLRDQVTFLCQALRAIPNITSLHIHLHSEATEPGISKVVLAPFLALSNVRSARVTNGQGSPVSDLCGVQFPRTAVETTCRSQMIREIELVALRG